jgi:ribonuclease VapC
MNPVLDASAVLALIFVERGHQRVAELLDGAFLSTVNLSEVMAKLVKRGMPHYEFQRDIAVSSLTIVPFEPGDAYAAAELRRGTRRFGLSFGDRACFALAQRLRLPVLTAERAWAGLDLGVSVEVIR